MTVIQLHVQQQPVAFCDVDILSCGDEMVVDLLSCGAGVVVDILSCGDEVVVFGRAVFLYSTPPQVTVFTDVTRINLHNLILNFVKRQLPS